MPTDNIDAVEPFHRFVLLAVIELRNREDTPVHSFDVTGVCEDLLAEFETLGELVPGGVTRQRVISALNDLEETELLGKETKQSATGKGRPAYTLQIDEAGILDNLADDEQFAPVVERIRG